MWEEPTFSVSGQMTVGLLIRWGGIGFYEVSETESEKQSVYVPDAEEGAEHSRGVCVWWLEQVEAQAVCLSTKYITARRQSHAHRRHYSKTTKTTSIKNIFTN